MNRGKNRYAFRVQFFAAVKRLGRSGLSDTGQAGIATHVHYIKDSRLRFLQSARGRKPQTPATFCTYCWRAVRRRTLEHDAPWPMTSARSEIVMAMVSFCSISSTDTPRALSFGQVFAHQLDDFWRQPSVGSSMMMRSGRPSACGTGSASAVRRPTSRRLGCAALLQAREHGVHVVKVQRLPLPLPFWPSSRFCCTVRLGKTSRLSARSRGPDGRSVGLLARGLWPFHRMLPCQSTRPMMALAVVERPSRCGPAGDDLAGPHVESSRHAAHGSLP